MAALMFNRKAAELFTHEGKTHVVPNEVIEQAEPEEQFAFALRYAYKAGLITRQELQFSLNEA